MTTVSAGSAGSYTFAANEQALISPTQGEACEVTVLRAGAVIASQRITTEKAIGPFRAGDVMTLTAQRGAVDYTVSTYAGSHTDTLDSAELTALQALVSGVGNGLALVNSTGYHFAGIPGDHINTAVKWFDRSGMGNDASFQASITAAAAWANPGYCTIPDPVGTTALMALPALNFDYAAGESLFIFWRGLATPEASDYPIMGDSGQNNSTYDNGVALICKTTGKMHIRAYDAAGTAYAGGDSATTVFSATVENSFAVLLDGVTRTYCYWANGVREPAFASNFLSFNGGAATDTVSGRTFKLGGSDIVTAATQWGVLQKVKQLHILRRAAGLGTPAGIDAMVMNLHKNPTRLVTAAEW